MIRILSVECDAQSQDALRDFFAGFDDLSLAGTASSAADATEILRREAFDVVLVSLSADDMEPIALTRQIRELHPQTRVLMFASAESPETIFAAMDAGADAYLLKGKPDRKLESAIRSIRLSTVWLDPAIAHQLLEVIANADSATARVLPTGMFRKPLHPDDHALLKDVAHGSCEGGVCMVDPSFISKLKRFAPTPA